MRVLYFNFIFFISIVLTIYIFFFNTTKLNAQNTAVVIRKKSQPTATADSLSAVFYNLLKTAESSLFNASPNFTVMSMFENNTGLERTEKAKLAEKAKNIKKALEKNEHLYPYVDNELLNQISNFENFQIQAPEGVVNKANSHLNDIYENINNYEKNSLQKIYASCNSLENLIKDSIKIKSATSILALVAVTPLVANLDLWLLNECGARANNANTYNIYLLSVKQMKRKCPNCLPIKKDIQCTIAELKANSINKPPKNRQNCSVSLDKYHVFITQKVQNIETIISHGFFEIKEPGSFDIEITLK